MNADDEVGGHIKAAWRAVLDGDTAARDRHVADAERAMTTFTRAQFVEEMGDALARTGLAMIAPNIDPATLAGFMAVAKHLIERVWDEDLGNPDRYDRK